MKISNLKDIKAAKKSYQEKTGKVPDYVIMDKPTRLAVAKADATHIEGMEITVSPHLLGTVYVSVKR